MATRETAALPVGLPAGRRTPRGNRRWYLVHTPQGRERSVCEKVRSAVAPDLLDDAFVIYKERWVKRDGKWQLNEEQAYPEYFFVSTHDVQSLGEALRDLSFPVRIAGSEEHAYIPLAPEAQEWFESAMDDHHVLRNSTAVIVDGRLQVQDGPLRGQEARVRKIDRHKRRCIVNVCDAGGVGDGFIEHMPMEVPFKS